MATLLHSWITQPSYTPPPQPDYAPRLNPPMHRSNMYSKLCENCKLLCRASLNIVYLFQDLEQPIELIHMSLGGN